jgi:hypothetical protein
VPAAERMPPATGVYEELLAPMHSVLRPANGPRQGRLSARDPRLSERAAHGHPDRERGQPKRRAGRSALDALIALKGRQPGKVEVYIYPPS